MSYKDKLTELEGSAPSAYSKSDSVLAAQKALSDYEATKPGAYQSRYTAQLDNMLSSIQNRKFDYDFNQDALYKNYRDRYVEQGRQAAVNAAADTAALTGGYGSTAATSAAAQANQQYLLGLNDVIPDLYNLALARYQQEGQDLTEAYGLTKNADDTEYSRYTDTLNDWYNYLDYLSNRENTEYNRDYTQWGDKVNRYNTDRSYYYQGYRDDQAQEQSAARSAAVSSYSGSSGSSSGSSGKKSSSSSKKSSSSSSKSTYTNMLTLPSTLYEGISTAMKNTNNALSKSAKAENTVKSSALLGLSAKSAFTRAAKSGVSDTELNSIMKKYYK